MRGATFPTAAEIFEAAEFQSTLLMRGATRPAGGEELSQGISIHAPHARSDTLYHLGGLFVMHISIHAPHARSDDLNDWFSSVNRDFNPRSSCEERHFRAPASGATYLFQSTLLMRGATASYVVMPSRPSNFNPRSSCEERHCRSAHV